jgi:hypothetical protein
MQNISSAEIFVLREENLESAALSPIRPADQRCDVDLLLRSA